MVAAGFLTSLCDRQRQGECCRSLYGIHRFLQDARKLLAASSGDTVLM